MKNLFFSVLTVLTTSGAAMAALPPSPTEPSPPPAAQRVEDLALEQAHEIEGGCGEGFYDYDPLDDTKRGISSAEGLLKSGKSKDAAAMVLRIMPHVARYNAFPSRRAQLLTRGTRVLSLALARSGGTIDVRSTLPDYVRNEQPVLRTWMAPNGREAALSWAVEALRQLSKRFESDVTLQTDLGEALSYSASSENEGFAILDNLARKDLLTSAEAQARLAALRSRRGDAAGAKAAAERCAQIRGSACSVDGLSGS